jgi:1-pyrroline-5-carboxylate dehydrogenase
VLHRPELGGIHFTGSTPTFQSMWRTVGENIARYRQYPRIVGETGGKDFIVAHASGDAQAVAVAIARGGFEYQGQKCSAASRVYVPDSLWPEVKRRTVEIIAAFKQGDPRDFSNFVSAVIDERAFRKHEAYLALARENDVCIGGTADGSKGWFVKPTVFTGVKNDMKIAREEIFGPVVSVIPFKDENDAVLQGNATNYGLAAGVWTRDVSKAHRVARAIRAGTVWVNCYNVFDAASPFGGYKQSGFGRELGRYAIDLYTQVKSVWLQL